MCINTDELRNLITYIVTDAKLKRNSVKQHSGKLVLEAETDNTDKAKLELARFLLAGADWDAAVAVRALDTVAKDYRKCSKCGE